MLDRQNLITVAAAGSAAILAAAYGFQHIGGLAPCQLCLWQRWPHAAAIAIGLVGMVVPLTLLIWAGALAMMANVGIAAFHSGVERKWWDGLASCSGGAEDLSTMSGLDLISTQIGTAVVMCDEIPWSLFGLSMANYNIAAGLVLTGLWVWAARRPA